MTITTVFDNVAHDPKLQTLWGFACVVETGGNAWLFDTGSNGPVLLRNMHALGKAPEAVRTLFCSHAHWDHMGGLGAVVDANVELELILPSSFSKMLVHDLRTLARTVRVVDDAPAALAPGVWSTGMMGAETPEHSLVFEHNGEAVVLTGCAHAGVVDIVRRAKEISGLPVGLLMGGFHLKDAEDAQIVETVEALKALGVRRVCPTHCSGDRARKIFRAAYGPDCLDGGLGSAVLV